MEIYYSANSSKRKYKNKDGDIRLYIGSFELLNGMVDLIKHKNGYLRLTGESNYHAQYYIKDYLGNIVTLFPNHALEIEDKHKSL